MSQLSRRQMPVVSSRDRLVSADLEAALGYDSAEYYWLIMVLDGYLDGRFTVTAFWMWLYKTLNDTDNLDLLQRCKIFLLDHHLHAPLDEHTEYVEGLAHDAESAKKMWSGLGLPVGQAEWDRFDTQRGIEHIRVKELERRRARAIRLDRVDQPTHHNTVQAHSFTTITQNMADPNMFKHPVKQFGTSTQPATNEDANMSQQSSKSPGSQFEQSDFTFEMARDGGPVMASSMPVDMPVASVVSAATPAIKSALKDAANDATERTSTHKTVSASKFPEPINAPHKTVAPVIIAAPGVGKRPVWKSPWKQNMPIHARFPNIDIRPTFDPDQSPDQYIEPLSDDEPDLTKMTEEEKGRAVYNQLLNLGERQKAVTGKYRSVADDIKAQTEAEKKAQQAQKESEDVEMGGQ